MNELKAEFWLCMSRAFLPPRDDTMRVALVEDLADDLEELASGLEYAIAPEIAALRQALAAFTDGQDLLAAYSRLFLVPGVAHPHINAGVYIDGAMHGETLRRLVECYRACGLEKNAEFTDLPDHVATQLEFTAWLYATAAARERGAAVPDLPLAASEFLSAFVARWAPFLRQDLEATAARFELPANPWLALARVLERVSAIEVDAVTEPALPIAMSEVAQWRQFYAGRTPDAEDLARLRQILEAQGLSGAHLDVPVTERDAAAGFTVLQPPQPPRAVKPSPL